MRRRPRLVLLVGGMGDGKTENTPHDDFHVLDRRQCLRSAAEYFGESQRIPEFRPPKREIYHAQKIYPAIPAVPMFAWVAFPIDRMDFDLNWEALWKRCFLAGAVEEWILEEQRPPISRRRKGGLVL